MVGNGNVAVDVARMLALTHDELAATDTTDAAIDAITGAGIREIVMLGRRGPAQAAFTNPELKELGELAGADVVVDPADLVLDAGERGRARRRRARRRAATSTCSREYAARTPEGKAAPARAPVPRLAGRDPRRRQGRGDRGRPQHARRRREPARSAPSPTGERETIPCGLVLRSVGYRGVALPGVPFDDDARRDPERRRPRRRRVGRADPGPLLRRLDQARPERRDRHEQARTRPRLPPTSSPTPRQACSSAGAGDLEELLAERGMPFVEYAGWEAIDEHERALGAPHGRPRVKLVTWDELLGRGRSRR